MKVLNITLLCLIATLFMKFGQPTDYVTSMELELNPALAPQIFNPPEASRTYSSVYPFHSTAHKLSMIDSV
jgi:hypothetical protein